MPQGHDSGQGRSRPGQRALDTVTRWLATGDPRSASLWLEWQRILDAVAWRKVLGRTRHVQQLRQASPLVTILPQDVRQRILQQLSELKKGVLIASTPPDADASEEKDA